MGSARRVLTGLSALTLAVVALCAASSSAGAATPFVSGAPGQPFSTGMSSMPKGVAFSPSGAFLAAGDSGTNEVSVFEYSASGAAQVPGSPFSNPPITGGNATSFAVAFSPSGALLATANFGDNSVSLFEVSAGGVLTPVTGSPFALQAGATAPVSVAFSPNGALLATADNDSSDVSLFQVSGTGTATTLTPVTNSPFTTGAATNPASVAFSHNGALLAAADSMTSRVALFSVSGTGAATTLTPVTNSPFATGTGTMTPVSVAFNAAGTLVATANRDSDNVALLSVSGSGAATTLSKVTGSPFSTGAGSNPFSVAFNPNGALLATANNGNDDLSLFSVSGSGAAAALTELSGSPFSTVDGSAPTWVAFSGGGAHLATADHDNNDVSLFALADPSATIVSPANGATFIEGEHVLASYSCADALGGLGIATCSGLAGDENVDSALGAAIDTSSLGPHTFTVTATGLDGLTGTATATYTVVAQGVPPPILIITRLSQSHASWREPPRKRRARHSKAPLGTTFSFGLSESAKVTLSFTARRAGRRVGKRCVAQMTHNKHRPRCKRTVTVGTLTVAGHPGTNRVRFQGKLAHETLAPGRYTLTVTATNAGQRYSAATLSFTIVSR